MQWNRNKTTAIGCFIFSVFVMILTFNIESPPSATADFLGPKGFPLIISSILILSSIGIYFVKVPSEEEENNEVGMKEIINLLPFIGILIVFILVLPYVGMVIGIFLLMMTLIYLIQRGKWMINTIISASVAIGIWIIFAKLLNIAIPAWPSIV